MRRGEDGALAPQQIDVAGKAGGGLFGVEQEFEREGLDFSGVDGRRERPRIALRGEEGRARGVERSQRAGQRGMLLGFGYLGEVVRMGAQIDEVRAAAAV